MTIDIMVIIWFSLIILAALIEINTMDLTSLWFAVGALIAFILALVEVNPIIQVIVFGLITLLLIVSVRPIVKNYFKTNVIGTNSDRLIGKVATCTKAIKVGERGEVKIDGKYWLAVSASREDVAVDEKVEVLAIEGVKLIVDKIK
ncbi:MAG: NfeD family protein [Candidatus Izimaplasma sp.]|nr:NfeD family protein [Candidatus Izimaplasma bacterium]